MGLPMTDIEATEQLIEEAEAALGTLCEDQGGVDTEVFRRIFDRLRYLSAPGFVE